MNFECANVKVGGFYTFFINGEPVFEVPSKNLITDFGWNRLSNLAGAPNNALVLSVGTGNTPPALTDTALVAHLAQVTGTPSGAVGTGTDAVGNYTFNRITFAFAQGAVVGNIAEVGLKIANADSGLTSRSLVKDGLGNPAVIVVTAIDQLNVLYELRYYNAAIDITSSVTVAGVPTTYTIRNANTFSGTGNDTGHIAGLSPTHQVRLDHYGTGSVLNAPGSSVSGGAVAALPATTAVVGKVVTVNPTNTVVTMSSPVIATGNGNSSGGVVNCQFSFGDVSGSYGSYSNTKAGFSPAIPKDNTKTIQYGYTFTFTRL